VAHVVGVGRGADLLLYLLAVCFLLTVTVLFRRIAELEQRCVTLTRTLALVEAERSTTPGSERARAGAAS
jgi:hypothetical protein